MPPLSSRRSGPAASPPRGILPRCSLCPLFDAERAIREVLGENPPPGMVFEISLAPNLRALLREKLAPTLDSEWQVPDFRRRHGKSTAATKRQAKGPLTSGRCYPSVRWPPPKPYSAIRAIKCYMPPTHRGFDASEEYDHERGRAWFGTSGAHDERPPQRSAPTRKHRALVPARMGGLPVYAIFSETCSQQGGRHGKCQQSVLQPRRVRVFIPVRVTTGG